MKVTVKDDFNIRIIAESGQCFRANPGAEDGSFCFIAEDKKCEIKPIPGACIEYEVSVSEEEWNTYWHKYFDFECNYSNVRKEASKHNDCFMMKACEEGRGIRILRQNKWEMLISFIISQRKNIPAIKSCIEKICTNFGKKMDGFYAFPTPKELFEADEKVLATCGLGYRLEYIRDAAEKVYKKELVLDELCRLSDDELRSALKTVKGVGDKVANCVMLFAYHRTASVPVDTWVKKIMEEDYCGGNPFPKYGEAAGIMQQYAFFYKRGKSGTVLLS